MSNWATTDVPLRKGDVMRCQLCGKRHPVEMSIADGVETNDLIFIKCSAKNASYIVGMNGYMLQRTSDDTSPGKAMITITIPKRVNNKAQVLDCLVSSPRFQDMTVKDALAEMKKNGVWHE